MFKALAFNALAGFVLLSPAAAPVAAQGFTFSGGDLSDFYQLIDSANLQALGIQGGIAGGGPIGINGQPPRDPRAQPTPTGTSRIRGRVTTADANQPLRRAMVRLGGLNGPNGQRVATTDGDGRYEFGSLPGGRYTVNVSKPGYVGTTSKPIDLADNQHADTVNVSVPRGGVIAGRVLDEFGDPVTNAQVMAMRSVFQQGRRQLQPSSSAQSNDIGEFRIFGLMPGQYYVAANLRSNPQMIVINGVPQPQPDESGYATTYYPGTPDSASATRLTIAAGQTVSDLTVALSPTHLAKITGTAYDSQGRPMARGNVSAMLRNGNIGFGGANGQIKPDGTFIVPNVSPGDYTLRATMPPAAPIPPPVPGSPPYRPETATANVTVNGADITDIALYPEKPVKASGRIVFDDMAAAASGEARDDQDHRSNGESAGQPAGGQPEHNAARREGRSDVRGHDVAWARDASSDRAEFHHRRRGSSDSMADEGRHGAWCECDRHGRRVQAGRGRSAILKSN